MSATAASPPISRQLLTEISRLAVADGHQHGPRKAPVAPFDECLEEALRDEWDEMIAGNTGIRGF